MSTPVSVYRFGRCEVDVGTRELRVDGVPRPLEPLAFDLLAYLLRHRERAVSKDELLDHVWLGRIVSVGSVARAAMTVRHAIADASAPPPIRTLHRVGYRFVAEVTELSAAPAAPVPSGGGTIVVALLPFENLTGDLALDWTTLGLMALVGNALALDARLVPLSVHAVSAALRELPAHAGIRPRAEALQRLGGAQQVVHTRIYREGHGYRLDYGLVTSPGGSAGTVHAEDPIRLGRALARRLLGHLLPDAPAPADGFAAGDPWALEVYARAMQAIAERQDARAVRLLRVVLDLEPDHAAARAELQRIEAGPA